MFCEKCGEENPETATFCKKCGNRLNRIVTENNNIVKDEKNMVLALVISFLFTGLGIAYGGNTKRGVLLFIAGLITGIIGLASPLFSVISRILWGLGLFWTYNQVKIANGVENPNLIEDVKSREGSDKLIAIIVIAVVGLIIVGGVVGALAPKTHNTSTHYYTSADTYSSGSGGSYSSPSSSSYSSSSNGRDVESHYEDEHGSADTYGTVYDDGSVESHQTGHTDYGDYKVDSYMDSDGNIHGTVDVGGKTYTV